MVVVQKTKLMGDSGRLIRDLLDGLLEKSFENKRDLRRAWIASLHMRARPKKDCIIVVNNDGLWESICGILWYALLNIN